MLYLLSFSSRYPKRYPKAPALDLSKHPFQTPLEVLKMCVKSIVKLTQAKIVTFLIFSWSYIVLKAFNETNFPFINLLTSEICQETNC